MAIPPPGLLASATGREVLAALFLASLLLVPMITFLNFMDFIGQIYCFIGIKKQVTLYSKNHNWQGYSMSAYNQLPGTII
jgi:hypothetical protein